MIIPSRNHKDPEASFEFIIENWRRWSKKQFYIIPDEYNSKASSNESGMFWGHNGVRIVRIKFLTWKTGLSLAGLFKILFSYWSEYQDDRS